MQVDLYKLIKSLLPLSLRAERNVHLIKALTSQAETPVNAFNLSVPERMYKINANASVLSLQHHIKREFDIDCVITELDGLPVDFLITISGEYDPVQVRSLVNQFKLAGRSFIFDTGVVVYTCTFNNHQCVTPLSENTISIVYDPVTDEIYAQSLQPLEFDVFVDFTAVYDTGTAEIFTYILAGQTESEHFNYSESSTYQGPSTIVRLGKDANPYGDTYEQSEITYRTNTGNERSLTMEITMRISGAIQENYPITYQGRNEFTWNSVTWPAITVLQMQTLTQANYDARLAAFTAYVESLESGLDLDTDITAGYEAERENLTACPI